MDDIAIVGIGLRFPGDAASPEDLWRVLERGESQWSEFPRDRLNIGGYYHPGGDRQGSISFKGAHFLKGSVAAFDAPFFSVSAEDAKAIDPQQRILLEASYEALENAGIRKEDVDGSDTAVYVGSFVKDYEQICLRDPDWQPQYAATGNGIAIMANRISHAFNFHGPSVTVDTGCSGSLVSVHLAAQSLRNGESSLALAAGAGMILTPNTIMPMTALNFLSPDGKCFTFDARANGYGRGEGIGVVVLKRVADALHDNDTIRAVIRGSRVNQDGRTTGITLPSKEAQVANIRSLYESAGLCFAQTAYVECHGTGTQAGDWRELRAISETLGASRDIEHPIIVGSLKPNIGHLEGAAGVAGLIKGVLTLEHGRIPPNINYESPNPDIDFRNWMVKVPTTLMDWPIPGTRRVSVNCFGFGGTNAHVIVDETPAYLTSRGLAGNHNSVDSLSIPVNTVRIGETQGEFKPRLFCFSSNEKKGVRRTLNSHQTYAELMKNRDSLDNYAYTLGCRRSTMEWKVSIVASSPAELVSKMKAVDDGSFTRSSIDKQPPICFVFSGQGAQWAQMGQDLIKFEAFRESLQAASHYMEETLRSPFVLLDEISKPDHDSRMASPDIAQPATTALQVALVELLASFSILPRQVIGHSSGEIAAAFASGSLSREAAWELAYYRGVFAAFIPEKSPGTKGGMIAVAMSEKEANGYLEVNGHLDSANQPVQVACINGPHSVTLSGHADAINSIANDLQERNVYHRVLPVTTAYHSQQMKLVQDDYRASVGHINSRPTCRAAMFSSVTGQMASGSELNGSYWAQNMISPVQYLTAVRQMMKLPPEERPSVIVELSPRATLRSPTLDILADAESHPVPAYFSVLERKAHGAESLLRTIGELWTRGQHVDMQNVMTRGCNQVHLKCLADLPPYPWNHETTYWHESHLGEANRFREYPRQDLIGAPTADSIPFEPRWRGFLRISENPWIQDHQVQKTIIYPASGMVCMVLEGAKQMTKDESSLVGYEIVNMNVEKAMIIPSTAHGLETALNIKMDTPRDSSAAPCEFAIYSKQLTCPWERHATGCLRFRYTGGDWETAFRPLHKEHQVLEGSCAKAVAPRQLYELLDAIGMNYGSLFRNIVELRTSDNSCVSKIRIPDTKSKMPAKFEYPHLIHPATLDAMFQTLFAIDSDPMVPTFIESLFVPRNLDKSSSTHFTGFSTAHRAGPGHARADIAMRLDESEPYITIKGLHLTRIMSATPEDGGFLPNHRNLFTEIVWKEDVAFVGPVSVGKHLELLAHKFPDLKVLQIGGTCAMALAFLDHLAGEEDGPPRLSRYTIADIPGNRATSAAKLLDGTPLRPYVETINLEEGSELQRNYHYLLLFSDDGADAARFEKCLQPGGWILTAEKHDSALDVSSSNPNQTPAPETSHGVKLRPKPFSGISDTLVLLVPDGHYEEISAFRRDLLRYGDRNWLNEEIETVCLADAIKDPSKVAGCVVVSVLDFTDDQGFVYKWRESEFEGFRAMLKLVEGIIWITQGAHMEPSNPKAAPTIALARTLMSEDPLRRFVTLDLSNETRLSSEQVVPMVLHVFLSTFYETDGPELRDLEFAEKDERLYIPRLTTCNALNKLIGRDKFSRGAENVPFSRHRLSQDGRGLQLTVAEASWPRDGLCFAEFQRHEPQRHEVEISFEKAALSFRDLDVVMGLANAYEYPVGMDMVGRVKQVGKDASGVELGANVVALVLCGTVQSSVNVDGRLVTMERPGFVPSFFISAYYALICIAGIDRSRGCKVLVHAGASGFGLAAIEMCRIAGAEVFATVLRSRSGGQRERLRLSGVLESHIIDADSFSFVEMVKEATNGNGVDVVYNPTQEDAGFIDDCVRRCGTVVQFRDRSTGAKIQQGRASGILVSFDLVSLLTGSIDLAADLFQKTLQFIGDGPLNTAQTAHLDLTFEVGRMRDALSHISEAPYLGHVSVIDGPETSLDVPVLPKDGTMPPDNAIDTEGIYVLAGGLGGLGRSISELLVKHGARNLVFLSRHGAHGDQQKEFLGSLARRGVISQVHCVDICDKNEVLRSAQNVFGRMRPIRGVFQCAAVIKDAVFDNMSYKDWSAAFRPKTVGSLNLVEAFNCSGHDPFFIFLASSAGVIGSRGQANYAAGNGFQDALARSLRLKGKHAVAIDLGPVLGAGMLAENDETLDMLKASGFYGIRHQDFLVAIKHAITMETLPGMPMPAQVTMGIGTGGLILQNEPADPYWSRTSLYSYLNLVDMPPPDLSGHERAPKKDVKAILSSCNAKAAAGKIVCTGLMHMLAKAMNMLFEEMDAGKAPNVYGVDSLVAVGVRSWVVNNCGVEVSVFEVLSDRTVGELAVMIVERGGFGD